MAADLAIKEPCRVATTSNITLSGTSTIDGVAVSAGDRVLVRAQTTASQNGIYVAAAGAWARAADFDGAGEVAGGTQVFVTSGTAFADIAWWVAGETAITIGTDAVIFEPEFIQAGTGAVPRTLQSKSRDVVSVKDFGATGDGSTNDYNAIIAARDAAYSANRELFFPSGIYCHGSPLDLAKPGLRVRFEGYARLRHTGGGAYCVRIGATVSGIDYDFVMRGPVIIESSTSTSGQIGLLIENFGRLRLEDVIVHNVSGPAFRLKGVVRGHFTNCRTTNEIASSRSPTKDWYITGSDGGSPISRTTDCVFESCDGRTGTEHGLYADGLDASTFIGGAFEGLAGIGVELTANCDLNLFLETFAELNGDSDFIVRGNGNVFRNCVATTRAGSAPFIAIKSVVFESTADKCEWQGGQIYSIEVESGATDCWIRPSRTLAEADGEASITNSGTRTLLLQSGTISTTTFAGTVTGGTYILNGSSFTHWTRNGRQVHVDVFLQADSYSGGASGNLAMLNAVPYPPENRIQVTPGETTIPMPGSDDEFIVSVPAGQTFALLLSRTGGTGGGTGVPVLTTASYIRFSLDYMTA